MEFAIQHLEGEGVVLVREVERAKRSGRAGRRPIGLTRIVVTLDEPVTCPGQCFGLLESGALDDEIDVRGWAEAGLVEESSMARASASPGIQSRGIFAALRAATGVCASQRSRADTRSISSKQARHDVTHMRLDPGRRKIVRARLVGAARRRGSAAVPRQLWLAICGSGAVARQTVARQHSWDAGLMASGIPDDRMRRGSCSSCFAGSRHDGRTGGEFPCCARSVETW